MAEKSNTAPPDRCASVAAGALLGHIMLQNLPSLVAALALDPAPGSRVLDMCAAPGGKTTMIAQLMNDAGEIVAFDRSHAKADDVRSLAKELGVTCLKAYKMDATKAVRASAPCMAQDDSSSRAVQSRPSSSQTQQHREQQQQQQAAADAEAAIGVFNPQRSGQTSHPMQTSHAILEPPQFPPSTSQDPKNQISNNGGPTASVAQGQPPSGAAHSDLRDLSSQGVAQPEASCSGAAAQVIGDSHSGRQDLSSEGVAQPEASCLGAAAAPAVTAGMLRRQKRRLEAMKARGHQPGKTDLRLISPPGTCYVTTC